ncbi:MAG: 50S ribosomal protein L18 [Candidatus Taylorbacteria bacterium RIFCSPLOWO2_01_FULL_44_26]|uniref:Large ribosomal subunit protein uL18 n=2 Tax=Candidatus Tayloriibacteriota TaxID=1817919 RepID=A0A1G2MMW5_9BACT|nr:MAG: 50S ribosomal protein L18 [Candidatus Taylorbacteria bacterium RIFCSPHIGHO2_02_FULL_44_12]OHA31095.1 MAG: 50S ribosomal protein L18 [Candidatus Taylorbacteria bacterium RIFCSPLOWO2_01_FULL_44_26]
MKTILENKNRIFQRRRLRVRAKIHGTAERPRLSIFRSNKFLYAQIINDDLGQTLAASSSRNLSGTKPSEHAKTVGVMIAKAAKAAKIDKIVFDRNGYIYGGKIKTIADAAREGGLDF